MKINVRNALIADTKPITRIIRQLGWHPEFDRNDPKLCEDRVRSFLKEAMDSDVQTVKVAVIPSGLVVGYLHFLMIPTFYLPGPELYINQLFVDTGHQNQGVGSRLIQDAKEAAIKIDAAHIRILSPQAKATSNVSFYASVNFQKQNESSHLMEINKIDFTP